MRPQSIRIEETSGSYKILIELQLQSDEKMTYQVNQMEEKARLVDGSFKKSTTYRDFVEVIK